MQCEQGYVSSAHLNKTGLAAPLSAMGDAVGAPPYGLTSLILSVVFVLFTTQ